LLENDIDDPSKASHRPVARFKGLSPLLARPSVPIAEGAKKREILSVGRFEKILIF
jgi:hypothetical protein